MSQSSATEFLDKVSSDTELQGKVAELGQGAAMEDVLDLASGLGYSFTEDELVEVSKTRADAMQQSAGSELSEQDLELVAGGRANVTIYISRSSIYITSY